MATKKKTTTAAPETDLRSRVKKLRIEIQTNLLDLKTGKQKNTNVNKPLKKELAQLLTKINTK